MPIHRQAVSAVAAASLAVYLFKRLRSARESDDDGGSICPGVELVGNAPDIQPERVRVETSKGPVLGFRRSRGASGGIAVHFRGLPFAASTAGTNRWIGPQPRAPWTEPLDCTTYGEACRETTAEIQGLAKQFGKAKVSKLEASGRVGDDCLNLNIVTPSVTGVLPVMVWFHGGSNAISSNHGNCLGWSPTTSEYFAQAGVVSVSINYRQNMHGFAHFPSLGVTNLALRDMLGALQWVQDEIRTFGGDASNVTIYGESAGGVGVATLLACPGARMLFHKAIVQSGAISALSRLDYREHVEPDYVAAIAKATGCREKLTRSALDGLDGEKVAFAAGALSNSLLKTHHILCSPPDYHHIFGDDVLPREPHQAIAAGSAAGKPVMLISTASESDIMVMGMGKRVMSWVASFVARFALRGVGCSFLTPPDEAGLPSGALRSAVADLTAGFDAIDTRQPGWQRLVNYLFGTCGVAVSRLAEALGAGGAGPLHAGLLELSPEESPKLCSGHGADCFVLFRSDTPQYDRYLAEMFCGRPAFAASFDALCRSTVASWAAFARSGRPGPFGGCEWPPLPACLRLRSDSPAPELSEHAADSKELELWRTVCDRYGLPRGRL